MKSAFFVSMVLLALAGFSRALGQQLTNGRSVPPVKLTSDADQNTYRSAVADARARGTQGDLDSAEQVLGRINHAKPGTAAWKMETAQRLIQVSEQLSRDGRVAAASAFTTRALQNLKLADAQANSPQEHARIELFIGFVQERYLGDRRTALAMYQSAAAFAPTSARASENTERLKRELDGAPTSGGTK